MPFHQESGAGVRPFHKSRDKKLQQRRGHVHRTSYSNGPFDTASGAKKRKFNDNVKAYSKETENTTHSFRHKRVKPSSADFCSRHKTVADTDSESNSDEGPIESDGSGDISDSERDMFSNKASHTGMSSAADMVVPAETDSEDSDSETDDVDDEEMPTQSGKQKDEYDALKKELASIPLEDLLKVKEKVGLKVFNKIMHGGKGKSAKQKRTFKRENKNRPREMSSKRPVPVVRHMDNMSQKHEFHRDPRFDDLSGEYKDEYFEKNYAFIEEMKNKEKQMVKKELKKTKETSKKKDLQGLLMRMNQQDQVKQNKRKRKAIEAAWKSREKEMVKQGKQPYFLKKSEKKKLELAEKYKELQKSGKLEQYLSKKRKKNAQRERKKLPQQMNTGRQVL